MEKIEEKQKSLQRTTLGVAMITNFSSTFAASSLNIAIPHIGVEYKASATSVSWIILAFLLVSALLSIPFGRIADIYGRRIIMKSGILLFCVSCFLNIFSPNMTVFLLLRVLQGVGSAMIFATNSAILVDAHPPEKRGSVMGSAIAAVFIGMACGPVIGGMITHSFGWRSVFILITVFVLVALVMAVVKLPNEIMTGVKEKVNTASLVLFIISFGMFMYGLATFTQNLLSYFIFAAGVIMLVIFMRHELKTKVPVIEVRLFKNRNFSFSILATLFNFAAIVAVIYLLSIYLQLARGFSADLAGLIMISQPIIQAALSPVTGRLSDKKSPAVLASLGMGFCATALCMFAFLNEQSSIVYIIAGLILTGVGVAFFSSPNSNMIMGSVDNKDYGVAASVMSTARTLGQVIGMAVLTIIINAVIGNVLIENVAPAALIHGMRISFPIFAGICCIGIMFSLQRGRKKERISA